MVKKETKMRLTAAVKRMIAIAVMMMICIASVVSVMAAMIDVTVIDGEESITFETAGLNQEKILEKAETYGIAPLEGYDTAVLSEETRVLTIYRETEATVMDDGTLYRLPVQTYQMSAASIAQTAVHDCGMPPLMADDAVSYDAAANKVVIRRAFFVTLQTEDGEKQCIAHTGDTVSDFLAEENLVPGKKVLLEPSADTKLRFGMTIRFLPQFEVKITADGTTEKQIVPAGTVEDALKAAGITLGEEDELNVSLDEAVYDGMSIEVGRVTYREKTEEKKISYEIVEKESEDLYLGETAVETAGEAGVRTIVKKEKLLDGKVIESEELSNEVTKEPVDEVVLVGTKEPETVSSSSSAEASTSGSTLVDHNGNTISYSAVLTGSCSAYTGGGTTASGLPAAVGNVAVNPNVIPYGTRLYICSPDGSFVYGYAVAADTGGAFLYGDYLADLYYDTLSDCYSFGIRTMNVYILD